VHLCVPTPRCDGPHRVPCGHISDGEGHATSRQWPATTVQLPQRWGSGRLNGADACRYLCSVALRLWHNAEKWPETVAGAAGRDRSEIHGGKVPGRPRPLDARGVCGQYPHRRLWCEASKPSPRGCPARCGYDFHSRRSARRSCVSGPQAEMVRPRSEPDGNESLRRDAAGDTRDRRRPPGP
jgi:hypothetical protein